MKKILLTLVVFNASVVLYAQDTFAIQTTYSTGRSPAVTAGDINNDNIPDIITANYFDNTVSVLLGNGNGTFAAQNTYPVGGGSIAAAIADFNNDGNPDIVTANQVAGTVSVLLGNGDGTFSDATSYSIGNQPQSIAVADINGDGNTDIATANWMLFGSPSVSILRGTGDGTFEASDNIPMSRNCESIAIADLNADGISDIVVSNQYSDSTVSVMLGTGSGLFNTPSVITVGHEPLSLAIADVNDDSYPDIITANTGGATVSVLTGNGNGTFNSPGIFPTGGYTKSIAVADINGDGKMDIITTTILSTSENYATILSGNGNGTFLMPENFPVGLEPWNAVTADFNNDGRQDIAVANDGDSSVSVLFNETGPGNTTRINNIVPGNTVHIFPNPFCNELIIQSKFKFNTLTLTDIYGRTLIKQPVGQSINTAAVQPGTYLLRLDDKYVQYVVKVKN